VFQQKITDDERVLATVLYQRKLCTQDTLAELFEVSRRTIGDVVREVGPILAQHGFTPTPAAARFATAADILTVLAADEDGRGCGRCCTRSPEEVPTNDIPALTA
jgi:hypothetical protein